MLPFHMSCLLIINWKLTGNGEDICLSEQVLLVLIGGVSILFGRVLATLVENKELPDPFYGVKNKEIIDIADSGRDHYTFCFFTKFECKLVSDKILHNFHNTNTFFFDVRW